MKLSNHKKELLKEFTNFCCEECHKKFESKDLQIHRLNRKMDYDLRNIKILCKSCHRSYHENEF